jgi:hypothetical protein
MNIDQKLDILKDRLFTKFDPRLKSAEAQIASMNNEITMLKGQIQLLIQMWPKWSTSEVVQELWEDPVLMQAEVLRYRACGTTIHELSADDPMAWQSHHVSLDHEKKRWPYKTREEAYNFAIWAFGPTEKYHFFIIQDKWL